MKRLLHDTAIVILALVFPIAGLATITGTQALSAGQIFDFDTGAVVTSGGDILWTGTSITLQGSATAYSESMLGLTGMATFNTLVGEGPSAVTPLLLSSLPIPASSIVVGNIFEMQTNGGNYAFFIVTAQSGTSLTIQFAAFVSNVPTITQVLNNYSRIPAGLTNSGIAQGALFIIKGSSLASSTPQKVNSAPPGLPTTLNGASVGVTVGGITTTPAFYYSSASQLDLVMPSNTPIGPAQVTVTYNGQTSAPFAIQIAGSAFGFGSYYPGGSGLGLATNASNYALYNYSNSIPPGATVVLYGSGLGADSARDTTYTPVAFSIGGLAHIYIGGIDASIFYQGASGYPGLNEIDVTVPANTPTGCFISVVGVSATGVPTNFITLPIGTGACEDPTAGASGSRISTLSGQTTVNAGFVEMFYGTSPAANGGGTQVRTIAAGTFASYTGSAYGTTAGSVSVGGCIAGENLAGYSNIASATGLSAGTITVTGPTAPAATLMPEGSILPGYYVAMLSAGFLTTSGGTFQFQATAGTQVGAFMTQVVFPTPLLQWTNQAAAATVTRSAGLPITWTGGSPGTYVSISGGSSSGSISGSFQCLAPVAAGSFTVPSYVLAALPASTNGTVGVGNETVPQSFTATGLDYSYAVGSVGYTVNATYQ
jgi:uncharacterized protein (TIGR03437 family)